MRQASGLTHFSGVGVASPSPRVTLRRPVDSFIPGVKVAGVHQAHSRCANQKHPRPKITTLA